jgi:hypothetical protein
MPVIEFSVKIIAKPAGKKVVLMHWIRWFFFGKGLFKEPRRKRLLRVSSENHFEMSWIVPLSKVYNQSMPHQSNLIIEKL